MTKIKQIELEPNREHPMWKWARKECLQEQIDYWDKFHAYTHDQWLFAQLEIKRLKKLINDVEQK